MTFVDMFAHRAEPRVINARGLVWVDNYAVPMTSVGEELLRQALIDDAQWLNRREFISNGCGEGGFTWNQV